MSPPLIARPTRSWRTGAGWRSGSSVRPRPRPRPSGERAGRAVGQGRPCARAGRTAERREDRHRCARPGGGDRQGGPGEGGRTRAPGPAAVRRGGRQPGRQAGGAAAADRGAAGVRPGLPVAAADVHAGPAARAVGRRASGRRRDRPGRCRRSARSHGESPRCARCCSARYCSARFGYARSGSVRSGGAGSGSVRCGSVRSGSVRSGSVRSGSESLDSTGSRSAGSRSESPGSADAGGSSPAGAGLRGTDPTGTGPRGAGRTRSVPADVRINVLRIAAQTGGSEGRQPDGPTVRRRTDDAGGR